MFFSRWFSCIVFLVLFFCINGDAHSTLVLLLSHIGATMFTLVLLLVSHWCCYSCCVYVVVHVMLVLLPFTCSCYYHPMLVLLFVSCWCCCLLALVLLPFHIGDVAFSCWCYYLLFLVLLLSHVNAPTLPTLVVLPILR